MILTDIENRIKSKIEEAGTPLKDWNIKINYGIKTGLNEVFIIDEDRRSKIIDNCKSQEERIKTEEIIRPILRGRDINRYGYDWKNIWLLFIPWHFPLQNDTTITGASKRAEEEFARLYPSVYNYLLSYKVKLSSRNMAETGVRYEWYALQRWGSDYWEDFLKPKILWKRIGSQIEFCYDDRQMFGLDSTCFAVGEDMLFFTALLNSHMGHYLLKDSPKTGTGDLLISVQAIDPIRVPNNIQIKDEIDILMSNGFPSQESQEKIDQIIYKLYNLDSQEILFVQNRP